jgi:hypothetical protein
MLTYIKKVPTDDNLRIRLSELGDNSDTLIAAQRAYEINQREGYETVIYLLQPTLPFPKLNAF